MHNVSNPHDINTSKLTLTTFKNEQASDKRKSSYTLPEWRERFHKCSKDTKEQLPDLCGLIFGDTKSDNNCYRYDANAKAITAIVVEYDGPQYGVEHQIDFDEAKTIIEKARLRALLFTTSSHTEAKPRWRIIFPLSQHECSNSAECKVRHEALVAMANGLFNGQLAPESFTLSQPWHYGSVGNDNPSHRDEIVDGDFLNIRDDLFARMIYKDGDALPRAERGQSKSNSSRRNRARNAFETFADDMYGPADNAEVEFALKRIPADDYLVYMKVGAGLGDEYGEEGYELFQPWCRTSTKYYHKNKSEEQNADICRKKYDDFSEMTEWGIGTVFHLATDADPDWREQYRKLRREKEDEALDSLHDRAAAAPEPHSPKTNGAGAATMYEEKYPKPPKEPPGNDATDEHEKATTDTPEQPKKTSAKPPKINATPFQWIDPTKIPMRQWLYRPYYIRQFVSLTVSTGGIGKSSLLIAEALAMVSGQDLLSISTDGELLRVWYWNGEDPEDELQRRFAAAIKQYKLKRDDIGDRLFLDSGRKMRIVIAEEDKRDTKIAMPVIEDVIATLKQNRIDVLMIDPFVACHRVSENDNAAIERVAKAWSYIAEVANCSIMLAHHTRKTVGGNNVSVDDGRGASALLAAARTARTLNNMTTDEAEKAQINSSKRTFHFRSDIGKANLTQPAECADWFKLVPVDLENNPIMPGTPGGDDIGVVTAWEYPTDDEITTSVADIKRAQDKITDGGPWRRNERTKNKWIGVPIGEALGLDVASKTNKQRIEKRIKAWLAMGLLKIDLRRDPDVNRHDPVEFVVVGRPPVTGDELGF